MQIITINSIPKTGSFDKHQKISAEVAAAVTELPTVVAELIADYTDDNTFAELQLELEVIGPNSLQHIRSETKK
jgi:hypothetical protein